MLAFVPTDQNSQVSDATELRRNFAVEGFVTPIMVVQRKTDGQRGSMEFRHSPRFYFSFVPN